MRALFPTWQRQWRLTNSCGIALFAVPTTYGAPNAQRNKRRHAVTCIARAGAIPLLPSALANVAAVLGDAPYVAARKTYDLRMPRTYCGAYMTARNLHHPTQTWRGVCACLRSSARASRVTVPAWTAI